MHTQANIWKRNWIGDKKKKQFLEKLLEVSNQYCR